MQGRKVTIVKSSFIGRPTIYLDLDSSFLHEKVNISSERTAGIIFLKIVFGKV